jgi:plasmid stabilization system protein ParE
MGGKKEKTQSTYPVKISENAYRDIDDIAEYIAYVNHQPLNAIKIGDAIFNTIRRIGLNPFAFRECPGLETKTKMYRKAGCKSWLIIYRIERMNIIVLGVIHGSRNSNHIKSMKLIK